jgi:predicted  nucleic acid-binding Zn-ribbon protein
MLEIQDLTSKAREIESGALGDLEQAHFGVKPKEAVATLRAKAEELTEGLRPDARARFRRVSARVDRAVVPVIGGTCFGCYVSIPTATAGEQEPNAELQSCETCGRFIYIVV